jgi:hypothetical protein
MTALALPQVAGFNPIFGGRFCLIADMERVALFLEFRVLEHAVEHAGDLHPSTS